MEIKVKLKYLRMAPRKVRLIADLIRGKTAQEAQTILKFSIRGASLPLIKLLKSAIVNAKNNSGLEESNLYISKITVDEGPKLKRWQPRSRGQAFEIHKKTSHITLVLDEIKEKTKRTKPKKAKSKGLEKMKKPEKLEEKKQPSFVKTTEGKEKFKLRPEKEFKKPEQKKISSRIFRRKSF